jgi:putative transposase
MLGFMPRVSRAIVAGHCYHVLNRGNNRAQRFHCPEDYDDFLWLMAAASNHTRLPLIGACLMPNHVHLIVQPRADGDLARWMHCLFAKYSRRHHRKYGTTGRVWENRYRASAIQGDRHLLIGSPQWAAEKAIEFGIEHTLAPIGRPRRQA